MPIKKEEIVKRLGDAWLDVYIEDESKLDNPLDIPEYLSEDPHIYITWLLSNPDYFSFICKELLNIKIFPTQSLVLKNMWKYKMLMLIASRGFSKTFMAAVYILLRLMLMPGRKIVICGAGFRQSKFVFDYVERIWNSSSILRDIGGQGSGPRKDPDVYSFRFGESIASFIPIGTGEKIRGLRSNDTFCLTHDALIQTNLGLIKISDYIDGREYTLLNKNYELEKPSRFIITPKMDVYKVVTANGYSFKSSGQHMIMTDSGWKSVIDLTTKDNIELDTNNYFPNEYVKYNNTLIDEKMGWLLGLLVSEGTNTNRNLISITNTDKILIDKIKTNITLDWKESYREAYTDGRGWQCKESWTIRYSDVELREDLYKLGLDYVTSHKKTIPSCILQSPKDVVVQFLKGLYTGDGTCFTYQDIYKKKPRIAYYSVSEKLIDHLQILLLKFGIVSCKQKRESKISTNPQFMLVCNSNNAINLYNLLKIEKWNLDGCDETIRKPQITKNGNSFVISTTKGNKNIYIGSFESENECITAFNNYWNNTRPVVRVKSVTKLPEQEVLYDFTMPDSHSFCGNGVINHNCDEFHSINVEIFQNVILGFSAVSSDPVENIKRAATITLAEQYGIELDEDFSRGNTQDNQLIISGTAYYQFNHFYKYWRDWKNIIESRGDKKLLQSMGIGNDISWKDYCIIRIPYELVPRGFMDAGIVASAKFSSSSISYALEYGAVFSADSNGFFRRSLLEQCTSKEDKPDSFTSMLNGNPEKKYVIGIDPAFRVDNFGLVLIELNGDHKRIVYVWTSNTNEHKTKLEKGIIKENEFYLYCIHHIRSLMRRFNVVGIAIDSQGGGWAISEMLANKRNCKEDELPIYPIRNPQKPQSTDNKQGLHILDIVNFANYEYLSTANHTMRQDFEIGNLLFPYFDSIKIAMESDFAKMEKEDYSLEDCMFQMEELKNELCSIVVSETNSGREHWDTPETIENGKKGRLRKDRYSALLIANALANKLLLGPKARLQASEGGFAEYKQVVGNPKYFTGLDWLTEELNKMYTEF